MVCICLHNCLRLKENTTYTPARFAYNRSSSGDIRNGDRRKIQQAINKKNKKKIRVSDQSKSSEDMRNGLKDYVNSESGTVERKLKYVRKHRE